MGIGLIKPVARTTWPCEQKLGADFVAPVGVLTVPPVLLRADQRLTPDRFEAGTYIRPLFSST